MSTVLSNISRQGSDVQIKIYLDFILATFLTLHDRKDNISPHINCSQLSSSHMGMKESLGGEVILIVMSLFSLAYCQHTQKMTLRPKMRPDSTTMITDLFSPSKPSLPFGQNSQQERLSICTKTKEVMPTLVIIIEAHDICMAKWSLDHHSSPELGFWLDANMPKFA